MSDRSAALRRSALALAIYGAAGALLWWALPPFQRLLLLPAFFPRLVRVGILVGAPVVAALAWRYPSVGGASADE